MLKPVILSVCVADYNVSGTSPHAWGCRTAEKLVGELVDVWRGPIDTLSKAGRALEGIEALLGGASGGSFDLQVH